MDSRLTHLVLLGVMLLLSACGGGDSDNNDPLVDAFPIAYIKRPVPLDEAGYIHPDARIPTDFDGGADLYLREYASSRSLEENLTGEITQGQGDVKDVEVSYDGTKLLFSMRLPPVEGLIEAEPLSWNIWEYELETKRLRRIISSDVTARQGHDLTPQYLPDGRILFTSNRQRRAKAILLDEGKPQFPVVFTDNNVQQEALLIHVMNDDGTHIRQLTFNPQGHDLDPMVRRDGKVIFNRWNRFDNVNSINIYSMNPDGSQLQLLYGLHNHDVGSDGTTVQYLNPREFFDGQLVTILRPYTGTYGGGDPTLLNVDYFADVDTPLEDLSGTGFASLTNHAARTDERPSMGGRFSSIFPLQDGTSRSLVSWSQCRLMEGDEIVFCDDAKLANTDAVAANPLYGIYMFDHVNETKQPVVPPVDGVIYTDIVAAQTRTFPDIIPELTEDESKPGILHIRSVYDLDGVFDPRGATKPDPNDVIPPIAQIPMETLTDIMTSANRPARFLRLIKIFPETDDEVVNIPGFAGREPIDILGYAPIEPDGSVKVRVPANVPFTFQILDKQGRRIEARSRRYHRSYLELRPGETVECHGCHDHSTGSPHGRNLDRARAVNQGAQFDAAVEKYTFAGVDPLLNPQAGETMAEMRTRISCQNNCAALNPTMDIVYKDIWSVGVKDSFSYKYTDAYNFDDPTQSKPVSKSCIDSWNPNCRIIINYEEHLHPLWSKPRTDRDGMDRTCSQAGCHNPRDKGGLLQIPEPQLGSQLNLSENVADDPDDNPDQIKSYRELFNRDNKQEILGGLLVDTMVDGPPILDVNGEPVVDPVTLLPEYQQVPIGTDVGPPMSRAGANFSPRFFNIFTDNYAAPDPLILDDVKRHMTGDEAWLTAGELKLLSEWLDIGANYYNNPFDIP